MKIETKLFKDGAEVYVISSKIRNEKCHSCGHTEIEWDCELKAGVILTATETPLGIMYKVRLDDKSREPFVYINVFPHTPEGKRQAEARVEELNDGVS